jgi:hypothetical protein
MPTERRASHEHPSAPLRISAVGSSGACHAHGNRHILPAPDGAFLPESGFRHHLPPAVAFGRKRLK